MKSKLYGIIFCTAILLRLNAQDYLFINPAQSLITTNPSFAGSNGFIRNQQVTSIDEFERTVINTFDAYIKPLRAGLAVSVMGNDYNNFSHTKSATLAYAQHLSFFDNELKIIPSLQLTYTKRQIDWNYGIIPGNNAMKYFDLSSGLLANYKDFFVGATVYHFTRLNAGYTDIYRLPTAVSFNASYNILFAEKHLLNIYVRDMYQRYSNRIVTGANAVLFRHLVLGAGINLVGRSTPFGSLGYRHNFFSIVGSYTAPYYLGSGTWDLALSFNLRDKEHRRTLTSFETW